MVRISGPGRPTGIGSTSKRGKKSVSGQKQAGMGERVRVADSASLREKAKMMLADMPEVRLDRIEQIRDALERGDYQVESKQVASRIVTNALAERPW